MRSCNELNVSISRIPAPQALGSAGPFIVMRTSSSEVFIQIGVKRNVRAATIVEELRSRSGISHAMVGLAFNESESIAQARLMLHADPTLNGVYVPLSDFRAEIRDLL